MTWLQWKNSSHKNHQQPEFFSAAFMPLCKQSSSWFCNRLLRCVVTGYYSLPLLVTADALQWLLLFCSDQYWHCYNLPCEAIQTNLQNQTYPRMAQHKKCKEHTPIRSGVLYILSYLACMMYSQYGTPCEGYLWFILCRNEEMMSCTLAPSSYNRLQFQHLHFRHDRCHSKPAGCDRDCKIILFKWAEIYVPKYGNLPNLVVMDGDWAGRHKRHWQETNDQTRNWQ